MFNNYKFSFGSQKRKATCTNLLDLQDWF